MRSFSFTAKNIGDEKYLTYVMGEGCELDEDTLDYCEENDIKELVDIIYEEDEDFDYLTYDITGKMSLESFTQGVMNKEQVFKLIRNVAIGLINCKEQTIHLSYILLNRNFIYVNPDTLEVEFLCIPVESEGSVSAEFKGFVRQFIANLVYNVDEDLSYVGQLLTYINGDGFNLRGLIGLTEALLEDAGIGYQGGGDISTEGGDVISNVDMDAVSGNHVSDFMDQMSDADGNLPEIGDDEDEIMDEEMLRNADKSEYTEFAMPDEEEEESEEESSLESTESSIEEIRARLQELMGSEGEGSSEGETTSTDSKGRNISLQKNVKVNRAAVVRNASVDEEATEISTTSKNAEEKNNVTTESIDAVKAPAAPPAATTVIKINPYIVRETTDEKTIITKPVFKIGKANRGIDYRIEGNGAISRQHAVILRKGDSYYIKDNKSTNHTYVNDVMVEGDEEVLLSNNCRIRLGDEDFIFKLS